MNHKQSYFLQQLLSGGLCLLIACVLAACNPPINQQSSGIIYATQTVGPQITLTVFAADSLTDAFTALGTRFQEAYPGTEVVFNFAGSQQLAEQITQGAVADVFASADMRQMEAAIASERMMQEAVRPFASNRLVVIMPADNPAQIEALADLTQPGVRIILAAEEVPAGAYTLDLLNRAAEDPAYGAGYRDAVLANVIAYTTNVRAVRDRVLAGEADAGIVYTSDIAVEEGTQLARVSIPDDLNVIAEYPIALVSDSEELATGQQFIDFVLSEEGQQILGQYGFIPVE